MRDAHVELRFAQRRPQLQRAAGVAAADDAARRLRGSPRRGSRASCCDSSGCVKEYTPAAPQQRPFPRARPARSPRRAAARAVPRARPGRAGGGRRRRRRPRRRRAPRRRRRPHERLAEVEHALVALAQGGPQPAAVETRIAPSGTPESRRPRMPSPVASSPLCRCRAPQQPCSGPAIDVVAGGRERVDRGLLGSRRRPRA